MSLSSEARAPASNPASPSPGSRAGPITATRNTPGRTILCGRCPMPRSVLGARLASSHGHPNPLGQSHHPGMLSGVPWGQNLPTENR